MSKGKAIKRQLLGVVDDSVKRSVWPLVQMRQDIMTVLTFESYVIDNIQPTYLIPSYESYLCLFFIFRIMSHDDK